MWDRPDDYRLVIGLFLKGLALVYLAAFASLVPQIAGLAGPDGILPLAERLAWVEAEAGWARFLRFPTLFWLDASDAALRAAAWSGCLLAALLFVGLWRRACLVGLWALYLSLCHAGSLFMNFQWDYLLLEAGFLAIFLPGGGTRALIWLMRWLLFRLRFLSGLSKLISGDPAWSGLAALSTYFETQPLPHVGAWYAHHLPGPLLRAGTAATLLVEIAVPFLFLAPRRWRLIGAAATVVLQLLILATSNHNFFNLLTILLCLFLLDDAAVGRWVPEAWRGWLTGGQAAAPPGAGWRRLFAPLAVVLVAGSLLEAGEMVSGRDARGALREARDVLRAWHVAHRYHVFPTVKPERLEVLVEWSYDGEDWRPLEFAHKPGHPGRRPEFIVPHQPRLDWMMWFVPLGPQFVPWYGRFVDRLLEGSPQVIALLPDGTFPDGPPRFVRAGLWRYRFTDPGTRARTGTWWTLEWVGPFGPWPSLPAPAR